MVPTSLVIRHHKQSPTQTLGTLITREGNKTNVYLGTMSNVDKCLTRQFIVHNLLTRVSLQMESEDLEMRKK